MTRRHLHIALIVTAALAGCTQPSEQTSDGSESGLIINPNGSDHAGFLVVSSPVGLQVKGPLLFDLSYPVSGGAFAPLSLGMPVEVPAGTACVAIKMRDDPTRSPYLGNEVYQPSARDCSIAVQEGKTTSYALGALQVTYDDAQLSDGMTANLIVQVTSATTGQIYDGVMLGHPGWTSALSHAPGSAPFVPVPPGHYVASYLMPSTLYPGSPQDPIMKPVPLAGNAVDVAPGQLATLDATPHGWLANVHVNVPAHQFPDPVLCAQRHDGAYLTSYALEPAVGNKTEYGVNQESAFAAQGNVFHLSNFASDLSPNRFWVSVFEQAVTVPPSSPGVYELTTYRLDVDDVSVTQADGTVAKVPGKYTVLTAGDMQPLPFFTAYANATTCGRSVPTQTGIDVVAGSYVVRSTWTDATGDHSTDTNVTVP